MSTPTTSSAATILFESLYDPYINALLGPYKWGWTVGTGTVLTFSFPWANNSTAFFAGYDGAAYSDLNEHQATLHNGLTAAQQAAVRSALLEWSAVANVTFIEVADTSSNVGDLRFAWTSATHTTSMGTDAWGWSRYPNSFLPSSGDVWISTSASGGTDPDWSSGSANYASVLHEIGHTLGLKHPFADGPTLPSAWDSTRYSVMSYTIEDARFVRVTTERNGLHTLSWLDVEPDTPMLLDIAAIQYIYGPNMSYRTGNDVYTFDPETPFFSTIWDAGGTDTISVSNFASGCTIDLRDGHYSFVTILSDSSADYIWTSTPPLPTYDNTPNLAIAFGCVIENAIGGRGNDELIGNDVNNTFESGAGNDTINGGNGTDVALYTRSRASYTVTKAGEGFKVSGADGLDTLSSVERLKFADVNVALDIAGNAGQAYRLYQAAFNRTPDIGGLGYQMNALDTGSTLSQVAQNFINSPEFNATYGALSTSQFVTQLYANVLHRAPDAGGLAFHINRMESGVGRADVLVGFSESPENQAALIGVIQNGMVYTL